MARVQLALNVADLDSSVAFYTQMFGTAPHKMRPGYANFEVAEPPLKLVLIEVPAEQRGAGTTAALNHLGVEVEDTAAVQRAVTGFTEAGLDHTLDFDTNCCYAQQDKVWVQDPAGTPWEVYTITDDAPVEAAAPGSSCCTPVSEVLTIDRTSAVEAR